MRTQRAERILLITGLVLLTVWVAARFHGAIGSRAAMARFEAARAKDLTEKVPPLADPTLGAPVDFRLWSAQRISAYEDSLAEKKDAPLAILRIPKIDLAVPVFNDTDDLTLNRGVGRILGTARVGQPGNLGIAGHRDGFFRGLQSILPGDIIEVIRSPQTDRYSVTEIRIVAPEDTYVLNPTLQPTLTLVTCYPFYFVGHAPKRYIVKAQLERDGHSVLGADKDTIFTGKNTIDKENKR